MGKASKLRPCPARGTAITPAECGEHRHSRYPCPADCAFNPFSPANYDQLLATEARLDDAIFRQLLQEEPDAGPFIAAEHQRHPGCGAHAATVARVFHRRGAGGGTPAERWLQATPPGWRNDERTLLTGKVRIRVVLVEIRHVIDDRTTVAGDLLSGAELRLVDRGLAGRATRFSTLLSWAYPLPHFWRMSGPAIVLPEFGPVDALDALLEFVRHLGGPLDPGPERAAWLAENFCRLETAITATAMERRRMMFATMDAHFSSTTFSLEQPLDECRRALGEEADVAPDNLSENERAEGLVEAWVWFEPDAEFRSLAVPPGGRAVQGRVLLGERTARIESLGAARLARLRLAFERSMGRRVRFHYERRDDLADRVAPDAASADAKLVPPRLLAQPERLELQSSRIEPPPSGMSLDEYSAALAAEHRGRLAEEPIPALDGRTPRQAAADPKLRPALLRLMKSHVRQLDEANLATARRDDLNGLLRELGLHEIDFPPPPPRPRLAAPAEDEAEDDESDATGAPAPAAEPLRLPPPRLVGPPLSEEEAFEHIGQVMGRFGTAAQALGELDSSGSTLLEDVEELVEGWLPDREMPYFVPILLQAWFALVPPGVRAPVLDRDRIRRELVSLVGAARELAGRTFSDHVIDTCQQPGVMAVLVTNLVLASEKSPRSSRPSREAAGALVLLLRVIIDELDRTLRAR